MEKKSEKQEKQLRLLREIDVVETKTNYYSTAYLIAGTIMLCLALMTSWFETYNPLNFQQILFTSLITTFLGSSIIIFIIGMFTNLNGMEKARQLFYEYEIYEEGYKDGTKDGSTSSNSN